MINYQLSVFIATTQIGLYEKVSDLDGWTQKQGKRLIHDAGTLKSGSEDWISVKTEKPNMSYTVHLGGVDSDAYGINSKGSTSSTEEGVGPKPGY